MERVYAHLFPRVMICLAMLVALAMLLITIKLILKKKIASDSLWKLFVFWTIVPPFWFALEYFWLFKEFHAADTFESFKYGQEIAQKVWAAVVALVGARLFQEIKSHSLPSEGTEEV